MPAGLAQRINGLMGRDRIEPGPKRPAVLEQTALQVNLEKRVLEHILGDRRIAEVAGQITVQLSFISMDQLGEDVGAPLFAIPAHQLLVGELAEIFRRTGSYGLNHFTFRRGQRFRGGFE